MMDKVIKLYHKYGEIIRYIIIGGLTTAVSLITKYILLFTILDAKNPLELQISVVISWILSVSFAYITNRTFVFQSKSEKIIKEISMFVSSRIVTLVLEAILSWLFITYLQLNSDFYVFIVTIFIQFAVIVLNYILSKFIVFSNKKQ